MPIFERLKIGYFCAIIRCIKKIGGDLHEVYKQQ